MGKIATAYEEDLAYIHDVGFHFYALGAAPGLLDILRQAGVTQGLVVDLGCGSGLWARELVQAGYWVRGFDLSAAMLRIARRRVPEVRPRVRFQQGSFLEIDLPPCDAVTATGEIFNYLFDSANEKGKLVQFLGRVHRALAPGGVFIFDIAEPGRGGGPGRRQKHFQGDDWALLLETEENEGEQVLTRRHTTFRKVGKLYRRGEEVHQLHLYHGTELVDALRRLGFRARLLRAYGDFRLPLGIAGIVARK
jgi:SAM-dependent methyltransferase